MVDGRAMEDEASSSHGNKGGAKRSRALSSPGLDAPAKRSRVSRACDQCRASREKCDGVKPTCHTCGTQKRACTYNEPPKKRGIQPNYIRTLELALAWLFRSIPDVQMSLSNSLPIVNGPAQRLICGKDAPGAEALHQVWRTSLVCKQIDQMLSGTPIESGDLDPIDPLLTDRNHATQGQPPPRSSIDQALTRADTRRAESENDASITIENGRSGSMAPPKANVQSGILNESNHPDTKLKLPPNSWNLLEYYFAFTHSWCPITQKHGVLRTMYSYPAEGLTVKEASSGDHAELWSILALSAFQISHFNALDHSFKEVRDTARSLIPSEHDVNGSSALAGFERGHIKALLTLALLDISRHSWLSAWLEVGLAARLVIYKFAQSDRDTGDRADRPVLHLAAFAIKNTIARHLGIIPHMRGESIQGFDSLDEDGLEEWAPWTDPTSPVGGAVKAPSKAFSTFNALVHELRIAGEDYTSPGMGGEGQPQTIVALLDNACRKEHRTQPSKLAANIRSPEMLTAPQPESLPSDTFPEPDSEVTACDQPAPTIFANSLSQMYPQGQAQPGFMSIPTVPGDFSYPQAEAGASATGNLPAWSPYNGRAEGPGDSGDIFEELAMLDSIEPMGQHPQFMQNLGFGPDLDLAEFFGADYQPSNPLLAYMQPPGNGKPASNFG